MDTSVLVKPSQIHPERHKYLKLLQNLQKEDAHLNRLGVPITEPVRVKNHKKLNVEKLKDVYRKKHTMMPYKHEELK